MLRRHIHLTMPLLAALITSLESPAHAHSWYPKECCSNHDCMPVDRIAAETAEGTVFVVGQKQILIPRGFPVRSSPDSRVHICFRVITQSEEGVYTMPLCLFLPSQS